MRRWLRDRSACCLRRRSSPARHAPTSLHLPRACPAPPWRTYGHDEFDNIIKNRLFDPNVLINLQGYKPPGSHKPGTTWPIPDKTVAPTGALTVKSAWIEITDPTGNASHGDPKRFYTTDAWLQNPATLVCKKARVGLVGLHFVHKTPLRPQWIWSTFEQVDNVPEKDDPPGKSYTFNDGSGSPMPDQPPPGYMFPGPPNGSNNPPAPINIERRQGIETITEQTNQTWQDELRRVGSVWQYYKLVMTQWPLAYGNPDRDAFAADPVPTCGPVASDTATVNTVLETFFQQGSACRDNSRKTCMGCHNDARTSDFVWSIPLNLNTPAVMQGQPSPRVKGLQSLRDIVRGEQR
jgi:hypothetical protein